MLALNNLRNLKYSVPKEISIDFLNGSNFLFYHKSASRRFWRTIYLLRGKYWKTHNLNRSIEKKVTRVDKNGADITKTISYRSQFIASARFMARSLSNLANNVVEGIHLNVKMNIIIKNAKCRELNAMIATTFLNWENLAIT